jgi:hypothetical protein
LGIVLISVAPTSPRDFSLSGQIIDRELSVAVAGAEVALVASRRVATTEADGSFSFDGFEIGSADQVVVTHPDYRTVRLPLGPMPAGSWHVVISLVKEATELDGVSSDSSRVR